MDSQTIENLLPAGFEDLLPPLAATENKAVFDLCQSFADFGYQHVKPPLLEYLNTLHSETGSTIADQLFETQDPLSSQSLALRADITVQVARIAATRLAATPRPLRLSYAGQVARRKAGEERSARQFTQVGIEIIGLDEGDRLTADVEAIRVITTALKKVGINELIVDLTMPSLVRDFAASLGFDAEQIKALSKALDRRDQAQVQSFGNKTLMALLDLQSDVDLAINELRALDELNVVADQIADMAELVDRLSGISGLTLTLDVCEQRGTSYHQAVGFNLFVPGHRRQVGAGGRYVTKGALASGATLYLDGLLPLLKDAHGSQQKRLVVSLDLADEHVASLHEQGWSTVFTTNPSSAIANQNGASHFLCTKSHEIKEA